VRSLTQADGRPTFSGTNPQATYADAVSLRAVVTAALADQARFTQAQQLQILAFRDQLDNIVSVGAGAFDSADVSTLISGSATAISILTTGTCDGFLSHH
jgi:hypothetical protein